MNFLNPDKEARARKVVADPEKFDPESVERVALSRVSPKLKPEQRVVEVYKLLSGVIGNEKVRKTEAAQEADEVESDEEDENEE